MKRFVATLFLSVATFALASTPSNHVVRITGYETGHTAAVGAIRQTLDANVVAPIVKDLDGKKGKAVIWIHGSADQTGKSSTNDGYGRTRALEAKAHLEEQFYKAKVDAIITISTLGDEEDSRMIIVDWSIELPTQTVPQQQKKAINLPMLALGAFVLVMLAMAFAWKYHKKTESTESTTEPTIRCEELTVLVGRKRCVVITEVSDDAFVLPFPREQGSTELMTRKSRHNAKQAAKKCLADDDPAMKALIAQLMDRGIVRELPN